MNAAGRRRIDEIGDESRRRILDAAEKLFAERGFDRTSFVDISAESGISRGSIPWHFTNKEGLLAAVLERAMRRAVAREHPWRDRAIDASQVPPLALVLADVAKHLHQGNTRLLFMVLAEAMDADRPLRQAFSDFMHRQREELRDWFRAQRPRDLDAETAADREGVVATMVSGALLGVHLQWQVDSERVDLDASLSALGTVIEGHVRHMYDGLPRGGGHVAANERTGADL